MKKKNEKHLEKSDFERHINKKITDKQNTKKLNFGQFTNLGSNTSYNSMISGSPKDLC